jgi:acetylornithine deacetylase/succinyl-diaminopimelate desuccinylase-like protein
MEATLLGWCKRLISTPSVTTDGTRRIAELCASELLVPAGLRPRLVESQQEGASQVNLVVRVSGRDSTLAPLLLNTHLDTVAPGDRALWTKCGGDPFSPVLEGDRIYGLGAADTKLDFAAKAFALTTSGRPRREVFLVGTFGEEHGLMGARELAASGIVPPGTLAFVGEPSGLSVVLANKGLIAYELKLRFAPDRLERPMKVAKALFVGEPAHSSTPALGRNAIRLALKTLEARPDLRLLAIEGGDALNRVPARCAVTLAGLDVGSGSGPALGAAQVEPLAELADSALPKSAVSILATLFREADKFAENPEFGPTDESWRSLTWNAGIIRSAETEVTLLFELRPAPEASLGSLCNAVERTVEAICRQAPGVIPSLRLMRTDAGFEVTERSAAAEAARQAMQRAGLGIEFGVKRGCTEAGIYAAAGLVPVIFGPGPSTGVIHAPNEYNLLSQVESAVSFYRALLD